MKRGSCGGVRRRDNHAEEPPPIRSDSLELRNDRREEERRSGAGGVGEPLDGLTGDLSDDLEVLVEMKNGKPG